MRSRYLIYCLLLALVITGLYNLFMPDLAYNMEQHLKPGQIAEKDIIAPYDYPILKSDKQLEAEKLEITQSTYPAYRLSDEVQYTVLTKIDRIFLPLADPAALLDTSSIIGSFRSEGIAITPAQAALLQEKRAITQLQELLRTELFAAYEKGIYKQVNSDSINLIRHSSVLKTGIGGLCSVQQVKANVMGRVSNNELQRSLEPILEQLVSPNLLPDPDKQKEIVEQKYARLPKSIGTISANEIIIRRNTRITQEDYEKLQSLIASSREREDLHNGMHKIKASISLFLYFLSLGLILYAFMVRYYSSLIRQDYHFSYLAAGLSLNVLLAIINNQILGLQTLLIPFSTMIVTVAILIDTPFAFAYNLLSFAGIFPFVNWETFSPLVMVLASAVVILMVGRMKERHQYSLIWIYLILSMLVLTTVFALYKSDPLRILLANLGYVVISSTLSVLLLLIFVPFVEKKWNLATRQELLQLLDFNHPLLKKMAADAPGTYYHSLVVGNLAERAAERIGANSLLARVGSYYHDIGKITNPVFFTENNPDSVLIHDQLDPSESAAGIKNHVQEGIKLAEKYKLPPRVSDIILQHHGTGYIRYFLDKAEKSNAPFDLDEFRYDGPKPGSKEAAIVMIADIVESVAKSWDKIQPEDIRKILYDTVLKLIREDQFDQAPITIQDLNEVKESMIPILESIYRKRQQYPESSEIEEETV